MESTADQTIVEPDLALSPTQEQDSTPQSDADPISKDNVELASKPTNIKSTVPPKRPLTTGVLKRPSTSTTLAPSLKPTIVSTRASVGSTLSKPPSRPTITSTTARRPPITLSSTPLSHRSRPSIASTEDLKNVQASPVEPKRPMTAGTARRASLAPAGTTKSVISSVTASTGRRPPVATSSDNRSAMPNSKPAVPSRVSILSTPRTIRSSATTSNSTRPGAIQNGKKRLSTIPASPATQARSPLVKSKQPQSELMESTMSVDLQQKLEELRSIHKILRVTKTQDGGDKHDASEQEYAIEIEKILDDLSEKLKLSEARDNLPSKAKASIAQNATPLIATLSDGDDGHSKVSLLI